MSRIWQLFFGMGPQEASFARRGFHAGDPEARCTLEAAGTAFLHGYNAGLAAADLRRLALELATFPNDRRGFAFEGAAMALQLLDSLIPWRRAWFRELLAGPGAAHVYMMHIGAGWALARLRSQIWPIIEHCDPLLRWLMIDGYGFHEGYFYPTRASCDHERVAALGNTARRIFDQGFGRSLWFVHGAEVRALAGAVGKFDEERQADLWSGLGLACAYTGAVCAADIRSLAAAAGVHRWHLAQGASFAAEARRLAGNETRFTDVACRLLCGAPASAAAAITERARVGLPNDGRPETYQAWRAAIRDFLARERAAA